jgi:hypothetical protein
LFLPKRTRRNRLLKEGVRVVTVQCRQAAEDAQDGRGQDHAKLSLPQAVQRQALLEQRLRSGPVPSFYFASGLMLLAGAILALNPAARKLSAQN